jgi:hypothetical protein
MTVLVRIVNPTNGNEAEHKQYDGQCWIEIYDNEMLIARILAGRTGANKP